MSVHQIPPETEDDEFEEPENAVLRRELGLRPIGYLDRGDHPDQRPCPAWCWIAHEEEYEHEVDCRRPLEALHTLEPHPSVVATLYPGDSSRGPGSRWIHTATLEPRLQQLGQGQPVVNVAFRQYEEGEQRYEDGFLRLTLADARELVTALNYLIEMADRG